jgi:hypothetical protein
MLRIGDPAGRVIGQKSERRIQRAMPLRPTEIPRFRFALLECAGVIRSYDIFCCGLTDTTCVSIGGRNPSLDLRSNALVEFTSYFAAKKTPGEEFSHRALINHIDDCSVSRLGCRRRWFCGRLRCRLRRGLRRRRSGTGRRRRGWRQSLRCRRHAALHAQLPAGTETALNFLSFVTPNCAN